MNQLDKLKLMLYGKRFMYNNNSYLFVLVERPARIYNKKNYFQIIMYDNNLQYTSPKLFKLKTTYHDINELQKDLKNLLKNYKYTKRTHRIDTCVKVLEEHLKTLKPMSKIIKEKYINFPVTSMATYIYQYKNNKIKHPSPEFKRLVDLYLKGEVLYE